MYYKSNRQAKLVVIAKVTKCTFSVKSSESPPKEYGNAAGAFIRQSDQLENTVHFQPGR